jgi:hypothetical protein
VKFDPASRPEIVLGTSRVRILKVLLWVVFAQALLITLWFLFLLVKFRNNDTANVLELRTFLTAFALPASVLLLFVTGLAVGLAPRRNPTFRMLTTFVGGLMVAVAVLFRGSPIGIVITVYGLILVVLAFWPDKAAKREAATLDDPGARA